MDYSQNTGFENTSKEILSKSIEDLKTTEEMLNLLLDSIIESKQCLNEYTKVLTTYLLISDMKQKLVKELYEL